MTNSYEAECKPTTSQNEKKVERILDKRQVSSDQAKYLIKWSNTELMDAVWVDERTINCPDKIKDFEEVMQRVQQALEPKKENEVLHPFLMCFQTFL